MKISLDYSKVSDYIETRWANRIHEKVKLNHSKLNNKIGTKAGSIGWMRLPKVLFGFEIDRIIEVAERIRNQSNLSVVIGIGGSYLGARAAIQMMEVEGSNHCLDSGSMTEKVLFAGHNMSSAYFNNLIYHLQGKDVSLNVISKSGTTTEPAIAFRLLKEYMESKYGREEAARRIYVTTSKNKGSLRAMADREGYQSFVIPEDIGGRYSVLTPVGLLPMAVAGINIEQVLDGARAAMEDLSVESLEANPAYQYAAIRNLLYAQGKTTEVLVTYDPRLFYFSEWYKQLFGESEGKDGKGIFPAAMNFTTDLHSLGQYIQDGPRNLFETILNVEKQDDSIILKATEDDLDGLNYLAGRSLDEINKKAMQAAMKAHVAGGVPNITISIPELTPYYMGYLFYFFEKACAMSGLLMGVNPFDQPGVEAYKTNMFRILGKPGYEPIE